MKSGSRGRLGRLLIIFGIAGLCLAAMHAPLAVAILGPLGSSFPGMLLVMAVSTGTAWAIVATLSALRRPSPRLREPARLRWRSTSEASR